MTGDVSGPISPVRDPSAAAFGSRTEKDAIDVAYGPG